MGALLLGAGLGGSAIASHFVDRTKLFEETVKTCFCLASVAAIFFSIVSVCVFMLLKVQLHLKSRVVLLAGDAIRGLEDARHCCSLHSRLLRVCCLSSFA